MSVSYPKLTYEELCTLTEFFNYVDTDHDGFITKEEIKVACGVDINQDGAISEEEMITCARIWLTTYLTNQDINNDMKLTLHEILQYNNDTKN
jgi:Ca2+-binding EF-hand superfamily protein